jgi:lipoprotein-anchoring transpeptidase ErfK/SrfK
MRRPLRSAYSRVLGPVVAGLTLALAAACSSGANASWHGPGDTGPEGGGAGSPAAPVLFSVTPAGNAADVSVLDPVTVTAAQGAVLDTVALTNTGGKPVQGELDADKHTWRSTEPLGYGKSYTVAVAATAGGQHSEQSTTFTTIKPHNLTQPYLRASASHLLSERTTYGIGQPIVVHFDETVPDRAAAEKAVTVTTNPPVVGRWHWFDGQEMHWRPEAYWVPGTKVTVKAAVYGLNLGAGLYGQSDVSASFTIGPAHVAVADNASHHMQVYVDGGLARDIPVSMGKGGYSKDTKGNTVDFWTRNGPHVVLDKEPVTHMTSASWGITDKKDPNYYDAMIKSTVHISYSGEYVHMADWNLPDQGRNNTSHGCINVAPAPIAWFYDLFQPGDVVEVKNSPVPLPARDGLGDWTIPWAQW